MTWLEHRIPPPLVGALIALAMWGGAGIGPRLESLPWPGWVLVGALVLAGLALDLNGLLAFRRRRTTVNPLSPQRATALVTGGIYRLTRNPMYLGMALLLAAWAAALAALLPWLGLPLFVAYITRFQIRPEERALRERFGQEFVAYAGRVRRWL